MHLKPFVYGILFYNTYYSQVMQGFVRCCLGWGCLRLMPLKYTKFITILITTIFETRCHIALLSTICLMLWLWWAGFVYWSSWICILIFMKSTCRRAINSSDPFFKKNLAINCAQIFALVLDGLSYSFLNICKDT